MPEAMTRMRSRRPDSISASTTRGSASSIDRLMWSASACGAAPEPPSPPSMARKSGAYSRPRRCTASHRSFMNRQPPMAVFTPTGRPVRSRMQAILSSSSSTLAMSRCRFGLIESRPSGMPRICAISAVTFAAGSTPPLPGLAPCDSLISNAFTALRELLQRARARSCRRASRTPYLAVPICMMMSQPPSRW